ncbi:MAG: type II toxin-antitoxin system VapC family toxin [Chthoniobacterales bacterium]
MPVSALVDAGPLIGWLNASDQWPAWSCSVLSKVRGPLHTSEIILGEACWNLGGKTRPAHALLSLVRMGAIRLLQPWPEHLERTQTLMLKYEAMDAADASLVVLSEMYPDAKVITTDRADFTIYRRFRAQKIPTVCSA